MNLEYYQEKFDEIANMKKGSRRDMLLANIMTQMEGTFKIPLMQNIECEIENPKIIKLYREISVARTL